LFAIILIVMMHMHETSVVREGIVFVRGSGSRSTGRGALQSNTLVDVNNHHDTDIDDDVTIPILDRGTGDMLHPQLINVQSQQQEQQQQQRSHSQRHGLGDIDNIQALLPTAPPLCPSWSIAATRMINVVVIIMLTIIISRLASRT
jgi:hypothetical protein